MEKEIKNQVPQTITPPASVVFNMYLCRTGKILSNLAMVASILVGFSFFTPLLNLGFYFVMLMLMLVVVLFTLGSIFITAPEAMSKMWDIFVNGGEFLKSITNFVFDSIPYVLIGVTVASVISIILLSVNKHEKTTWRIAVSSILAVISTIVVILIITGGTM